MSKNLIPSISPKPTVYPPTQGCDSCEMYLEELENLEEDVRELESDLVELSEEVDSIPRITVDSELSPSSTNPVTNAAVTVALNDKQDEVLGGTGITVSNSTINLKPATTSTLGGIKVGNGLVVASDGTLSSTGGGGGGGIADVQMNGTSVVTNNVAKITTDSGNMTLNGTLTTGGTITSGGRFVLPYNTYFAAKTSASDTTNGTGMLFFYNNTEYFGNNDYPTIIRGTRVTTQGPLYVNGHTSAIGTVVKVTGTFSAGSGWSYYMPTDLNAGTWVASIQCKFPAAFGGVCRMALATYYNDQWANLAHTIRQVESLSSTTYATYTSLDTILETTASPTTYRLGLGVSGTTDYNVEVIAWFTRIA